ncbi:MAG: hypothetical protein ACXW2U_02490 [Telluria sp.]
MRTTPGWSDELKDATWTMLARPPLALGTCLMMKHCDGRFGAMQLADLLVYRWTVTDRAGLVCTYDSIAALVAAGWAID